MKKKHTREDFDLAWHEWQNSPLGIRRQKLLDVIVRQNTPLVQKFVSRILKRSSVYCGMDDAMQAGLIGLLVSLKKYDPKRPTRFSTMAWPWIRHEVQNMLLHQTQIFRPKGSGMPYKVYNAAEAFETREGREAELEELGFDITPAQFAKWKAVAFHFVPLDEVRENKSDDAIGNFTRHIAMKDHEDMADDQLIQYELDMKLANAYELLTDGERKLLIDGNSSWLSKEDAKKIVESAKAKVLMILNNEKEDEDLPLNGS